MEHVDPARYQRVAGTDQTVLLIATYLVRRQLERNHTVCHRLEVGSLSRRTYIEVDPSSAVLTALELP
ncbi:hypothetical protein D3C77_557460 [compost metagenome]